MENLSLGVGSIVNHKDYGKGVVIEFKSDYYMVTFVDHGMRKILKDNPDLEVIDALEQPDDLISMEKIENTLINVLRRFSDIQETVTISDKWKNGRFILQPGNNELKPYEMPIDIFFHKIVMVRDRLRVMEQRINSSENLSEDEKINLQQYLTRIYGSLTSFNILFKHKTDGFTGEKTR